MIIIGSRAMNVFYPGRTNEKNDYDVIMSQNTFADWIEFHKENIVSLMPRSANKFKAIVTNGSKRVQYEIELGLEGTSSKYLLEHISESCQNLTEGFFGELFHVLNPKYQMITKRSHLIYPIHFEKNMEDYQAFKRELGDFELDGFMRHYQKLRVDEAKARYKQKTPKLNVTTEDFFSSKLAVPNYFVHDHIHDMMAHYDKPIFSMMQKDSSKAWCSKDMFYELPIEYQIKCVMEEAYVIALERYIIPQHGEGHEDHFDCYKRALKRICTTLTSGWFRDFAIWNYDKAIQWYDPEFVTKFIIAGVNGKIKPQEGYGLYDVPLFKKYGEKF
jgi:hypothetical protein